MSAYQAIRMDGVVPKHLVVVADYDLSLVFKDETDFHRAPLRHDQYASIQRLTNQGALFIINTARGEKSVLEYFKEHSDRMGRIHKMVLGTNSGHLVHDLSKKRSQPGAVWSIQIPGLTDQQLECVIHDINKVLYKLNGGFPGERNIVDEREKCGAFVYEVQGKPTDRLHRDLVNAVKFEISRLPSRSLIEVASKARAIERSQGRIVTQGYFDLKPKGMDKGITSSQIFRSFVPQSLIEKPDFHLIVIGDSTPDYAMMRSLAREVGSAKRTFIGVDAGLRECDEAYKKEHNGVGLLDIELLPNGSQPITQVYQIFDEIADRGESMAPRSRRPQHGVRRDQNEVFVPGKRAH